MSRNPHSEFLKYHGFSDIDIEDKIPNKETTDMASLHSEMAEIKMTMFQVLQELRKLNT